MKTPWPHIGERSPGRLVDQAFPVFLILSLGIIGYTSSLDASFHFDDFPSILRNKSIQNLGDFGAIWHINPTRFVANLTFAINFHFHGLTVFGFHAVNILIHLLSSLSVYWLVRLLFATPQLRDVPLASQGVHVALAASLLFVCHPIQTQAVTYIVQRVASLAALFYFLSTALYIRARLCLEQGSLLHLPLYCGSIAAALLAMFCKENSITLPFTLLVVEGFFFSPSWRRLLGRIPYLAFMLMTLPVIPVTWIATRPSLVAQLGPIMETDAISRYDYFLTQFKVIPTYLGLLLFPIRQSLDYDFPLAHSLFDPVILASFLLLLALGAAALFLFRRFRLISFGIVWFFITLSVESSFIPISDVIFEHRVYLPSFGIFLSLTGILFSLLHARKKALLGFFALVIPVLLFLTVNRNITWREQVLIWNDAAKTAPRKFRVLVNRGAGYSFLDKAEYAVKDYERAAALGRDDATPYLNLGLHFLATGKFDSAVSEFDRALRVEPGSTNIYLHRGLAHMAWGKYDLAYEDFRKATLLDPNNPYYFNALGVACNKLKRYSYARVAFARAIALDDRYAPPHLNRGKTLRSLGNLSGAIRDFRRAAELEPDLADVYFNWALVHVERSEYRDAVEQFSKAVALTPGYAEAYNNRGMAYHRMGLHDRALLDLDRAVELNPSLARLYRNRSRVFQSLGREKEAIADSARAEDLEEKQADGGRASTDP
ncbi:MAG: tetratricopeptide repeat protein [Deltaproteobacteria bacterium]|nr:tetratricopeptide repeat protein [Deltaproteobacteria bacterium]